MGLIGPACKRRKARLFRRFGATPPDVGSTLAQFRYGMGSPKHNVPSPHYEGQEAKSSPTPAITKDSRFWASSSLRFEFDVGNRLNL